ncbi:hypothetical protein IGI04_036573 [Brassica rapa subsp. trilocularis]|uniref:Uncharacterized protein n=1 Tax=Brassica rapa subsp. trilocularis TaxID=1813537 RepID=A0ABQ7LEZ4_BRACM|nr:hypothetical protein IGI04_036573 [Brassica rapa subsp. trilocularis]
MRNKSTYYSQISHLILLRYYDDAACMLRKMCLDAKAPHLSSTLPPTLPWKYYMLLDESTLPSTFIDSATHFTLESIIERLIMFYLLLLIFINYKIQ